MVDEEQNNPVNSRLFTIYLKMASGFWKGKSGLLAWSLFFFLITLIISQLYVQYKINFWNGDFFNALSKRDVHEVWYEASKFVPLALASILIAVMTVWAKMKAQRSWRKWLSFRMIDKWVQNDHYRKLTALKNHPRNAEFRIAEDARVATDLPFELVLGLITALLTAITFISILWQVGGTLDLKLFGITFYVPGYLVVVALLYSTLLTGATVIFARYLTKAVEEKNASEAEYRSAASTLRSHGEENVLDNQIEEVRAVKAALRQVISSWRKLSFQLMRTTSVSTGNAVIAPVIGLLFCTPKYLANGMTIGQVVQAAAAFVTVQNSFNWLLNNYPSIADWISSSNRVAMLISAINGLEEKDGFRREQ